jgi:hypothetical protein
MLVGSIVVAVVRGAIDSASASRQLSWTFAFAPGTASTLLGAIAGATITTAGVVFSLLVVSLQLTSGQFSPRVLRGFWRDQFGQVLIGLLLSTFAFCVFALARLDPNAKQAPPLTVMFARAGVGDLHRGLPGPPSAASSTSATSWDAGGHHLAVPPTRRPRWR